VKHGGINATVPRDLKPEELTLDQAVALLAERAAKGPGKKPARTKKAPKAKANGVAVAAPANDTNNDQEKKPKTDKKKSAPKRKANKAKSEPPPRTGTDG
jgi:DNA topoisomerase-1